MGEILAQPRNNVFESGHHRRMIISPYRFAGGGGGLSIDPTNWWDLDDLTGTDQVGSMDFTAVTAGNSVASSGGPNGQDVVSMTSAAYMEQDRNPTTEGFGSGYSISCWAKFDSFQTGNFGNWVLMWRGSVGVSTMVAELGYLGSSTDSLASSSVLNQSVIAATGVAESTGQWYHLVTVYYGGFHYFYLDSVLIGSNVVTASVQNTSYKMRVGTGSYANNSQFQFAGDVAMLGMTTGAWTQDDVDYLYNSGDGRQLADL